MRIGMEKTVVQDLLQVGAKQRVGHAIAVELHARQRTELGELYALDQFHCEHTRAAVAENRLRHVDLRNVPQISREQHQMHRFLPEVELAQQRFAELVEELL